MDNSREVVLAIEAGIGCTVAVANAAGGEVLISESSRSERRADELALQVDDILGRVAPVSITRIVVGNDIGSATGLRVGIASALGLGSALGVPVVQLSVLHALASTSGSGANITAVASDGKRLFVGRFEHRENGELVLIRQESSTDIEGLTDMIRREPGDAIVLTSVAEMLLTRHFGRDPLATIYQVCETPLAAMLAKFAAET